MNVRFAFLMILAMFSTVCNAVENIAFSYSYPSDKEWFGYKKAETYDVAIRIKNPSLVGSHIQSIGVNIPNYLIVPGSAKGWISTDLILEKDEKGNKINSPDIASVAANIQGDSLVAVFTEPVSMPREGLYVGYSFTCLSSPDDNPSPVVAVGQTAESCVEDGWWMHASKSLVKWNDMGSQKGLASKLKVTFSGEFHENAASLDLPQRLWNVSNSDGHIRAVLSNNGTIPIKLVEYAYSVEGEERTGQYVFENPVMPRFGYPVEFEPEIMGMDLSGWHKFTMSLSSINGIENHDIARESQSDLDFIPFMPASRPLVEEYTGLWCGWCPSGYVILEQMYDAYPDNFVGISYHTRDVMAVYEEDELPSTFRNLPAMFINRADEYNPLDMKRPWEKTLIEVPPAEMSLSVSNPCDSIIEGVCSLRFVNNHDNSAFKVSYLLIADNLHNATWRQANYYNGNTFDDLKGPYSDIFNFGADYISDLRYDHVGIALSKNDDEYSMLPMEISVDNKYEVNCRFDLSEVHNLSGECFFNPETLFRIVAVLHDDEGKIQTCVQSEAISIRGASIHDVDMGEKEITTQNIYLPSGATCGHSGKGMYIVCTDYSDGTRKVEKIIK